MRDLDHEDYWQAFVEVVNIVRPEHSLYNGTSKYGEREGDPRGMWPMTVSELQTGHSRKSSRSWAACGPRAGRYKAYFRCDRYYFNTHSAERVAAVLVHEATHITVGSGTTVQGGTHPPRFWETMADYAEILADDLDSVAAILGEDIDREGFFEACCNDPNASMVDGRYETVEERKERMRERLLNDGPVRTTETDQMISEIQQVAASNVADK